jgi:hypothetical protein
MKQKNNNVMKIFEDDIKSALAYFELKKEENVIKIIKNNKLQYFFYIIVDDLKDPTYFSLFKDDIKIGYLSTKVINKNNKELLNVIELLINKDFRGFNLSKELYQAALESTSTAGLISFIPNRLNKDKISKIYNNFNTLILEDYELIYIADNL